MEMVSDETMAMFRRLMELRDIRDTTKTAAETAETDFREAEADAFEAIRQSKQKGSWKLDLGEPWGTVSFRERETYYGRVIDEEKALEYYESRARIDDVTAPKFVMKRIHEDVRKSREEGSELPPGLDFYANRGVTITRQKS